MEEIGAGTHRRSKAWAYYAPLVMSRRGIRAIASGGRAALVAMALSVVVCGCAGGGQSVSATTPGAVSGTTKSAASTSSIDPRSLAAIATAYARATDPWIETSFSAQAAFWPRKCLAQRGAATRHAWKWLISIMPRMREVYAKQHIPQPLPSIPHTADILDGSGRRGVPIADVTPTDRVALVFFIDPRTGIQKTAMQPSSVFSYVNEAWRYDLCASAMP